MSLSVDGIWKAGVWATTVWAAGVWAEGAAPVSQDVPTGAGSGKRRKRRNVRYRWEEDPPQPTEVLHTPPREIEQPDLTPLASGVVEVTEAIASVAREKLNQEIARRKKRRVALVALLSVLADDS